MFDRRTNLTDYGRYGFTRTAQGFRDGDGTYLGRDVRVERYSSVRHSTVIFVPRSHIGGFLALVFVDTLR
jgi:hypothetical protein